MQMIRRNPLHILTIAYACAQGLATFGCSGLKPPNLDRPPTIVQRRDTTPMMSPAQRDRRFRKAYADGLRLAQERRYGVALGAFEEAVRLKPESVEAMFNLGACHEVIGDPMRAIGIYRRILTMTPDDPDCYANLGTSYIKMFYREKSPVWRKLAQKAWRRSLQLEPDRSDVKRFIAQAEAME